jgi:translation initiation factor IF-2
MQTTGQGEGSIQRQRVYEVAKDMGLANKDLVDKIRALGIEVKNHMSALEPEDVNRVKRALEKERMENTVVERIQPTVIRRRNKNGPGPVEVKATAPVPAAKRRADESKGKMEEIALPMRRPRPAPVPQEPSVSPDREPIEDEEAAAQAEARAAAQHAVVEPERRPEAEPEAAEVAARAEAKVEPAPQREPEPVHVVPEPRPEPPPPVRHEGRSSRERPMPPVVMKGPPAARERQKTQFEIELERAREASRAKEVALQAQKAAEQAASPAPAMSLGGRPAVGSIIELPLTRIQITERGPGGKPLPTGSPRGSTAPAAPGTGQVRGRFEAQQRGGQRKPDQKGGMRGKQAMPAGKKSRPTLITTPAEHKRVIKMDESIAVAELAHQMGVKATEVLKKLWGMGMVGVTINQSLDLDTASLLSSEFGYEVQSVAFQEQAVFTGEADSPEDLVSRAPIVTIMGHVDHGKTSLLDAIRHTDVAAGEAGGITQHIGAYRVSAAGIGDVVFLDTPGHAAFTAMRARGAQVTDIVVLVVAADDGVMPQTIEAVSHAKDAKVPIIVAVNKIDKPSANPDRVKQQLSEQGLIPEDWGGDTIYVPVSAYSKIGIDKLLESIQLQAELLELKANPKKLARGAVIEAKLDRNRGPMATVLVEEGTLRGGDIVVVGEHMGKVRAMLNDKGGAVTEAGPSTPVEVLGIDGVPEAGDVVNAVADEKAAKSVIEHRRDLRRKKELGSTGKVSLENVLEKIQEGQIKELKIVLKTDVQGSAEALRDAMTKLTTNDVRVNVIATGVGGITESDVNLAKAGGAVILGFHVRPAGKAAQLAEQEGVDIKLYDIIYDAIDDVKKAMVGMLAPIKKEKALGKVEVRQTISIPKIGTVAGSFVMEGKVTRQSLVKLIRDNVQIYTGRLGSLRRFKDDVREVVAGYECGLTIDGYQDVRVGDIIEAYEIVEEAATL